ncbi:MAG: hypothetical protein PHN75_12415 [Syntrophales bacterium]|nr:hypothetical protein [Syntrophales bacterium]
MSALTIALLVFMATAAILLVNGSRILKKRRKYIETIAEQEQEEIKELAYVAYHGGFPALPKPQKLTLAVSDKVLYFVTNDGQSVKFPMPCWRKLEKFTTKRKHDVKQRSMILWGPFNNVMFKDQIRHFITINFLDEQGSSPDNHVLIEHGNPEQRDQIFNELNNIWNNCGQTIKDVAQKGSLRSTEGLSTTLS